MVLRFLGGWLLSLARFKRSLDGGVLSREVLVDVCQMLRVQWLVVYDMGLAVVLLASFVRML